jgi:hypothetical protein
LNASWKICSLAVNGIIGFHSLELQGLQKNRSAAAPGLWNQLCLLTGTELFFVGCTKWKIVDSGSSKMNSMFTGLVF